MVASRSRPALSIVLLGMLSGSAIAQSGGGGAPGAGGQGGAGGAGGNAATAPDMHPSVGAALANLQIELNALDSMNDAASTQLSQSQARQKLMTGFISSKKLDDAFKTFTQGWKPTAAPLSFQQAYTTAFQAEQLRGAVTPSTSDIDTLTNEVAASTTMVQAQWNRLSAQLRQTQMATDFIASQKLMDEYHDYATKNAAAVKAEMDARADRQAQLEKSRRAQHDARRGAALDYLQKQWDSQSHLNNSGTNYNYTFSQGASQAGQFSQTPFTAYTAGTGENAPISTNPVSPTVPTAYDFWTGTTFNTYADPYYDLNGWPAGYSGGGANAADIYRRANVMRSPAPPPSRR